MRKKKPPTEQWRQKSGRRRAGPTTEEKQRHRTSKGDRQNCRALFDFIPSPLMELDCSGVKGLLDDLAASSARTDLSEYLKQNPGEIRR